MRGIRLKEPTIIALETMRAHKLRSFLMLLGVILSVSTLILVVALINGTNAYVADRVANMGNGVFLIARFGIINSDEEFCEGGAPQQAAELRRFCGAARWAEAAQERGSGVPLDGEGAPRGTKRRRRLAARCDAPTSAKWMSKKSRAGATSAKTITTSQLHGHDRQPSW